MVVVRKMKAVKVTMVVMMKVVIMVMTEVTVKVMSNVMMMMTKGSTFSNKFTQTAPLLTS